MTNDATNLIHKLNSNSSIKIKKSTKSLILSLINYLEELQKKEKCKNYLNNPDFIIGWVFSNKTSFNNQSEIRAYCKCQLQLATNWLKKLINNIEDQEKGGLSFYSISKYKEHITSCIFELKPYVEYFERKRDNKYEFIWGVNPNFRQAWQIYREANTLYWSSVHKRDTGDHVISINLSIFSLRQSLEIKFQRILGVSRIYDISFENQKIQHAFFPEFINDNLSNIITEFDSLRSIIKIYQWTNNSIHTAVAPRTWEVEYALSYCSQLFKFSDVLKPKVNYSVHDAVKINNYNDILKELYQSMFEYSNHKILCFEFDEPEAIICS